MTVEFTPWPKIPRLFKDMTVTEKIDGTNAAIGIEYGSLDDYGLFGSLDGCRIIDRGGYDVNGLRNVAFVYAQSRNRLITPGDDNYGFANWVAGNAEALVDVLGEGVHFGEWWGAGIQRRYGLDEKRFSLFNTRRWGWLNSDEARAAKPEIPRQLYAVPVLRVETFSSASALDALHELSLKGSQAAPGFMDPEGIVVYHHASNDMFKATLAGDKGKFELAA